MKPQIIGYEKDGIKYAFATHLGCPMLSFDCVNVYFNKSDLNDALKRIKAMFVGSKKNPKLNFGIKSELRLRNGRIFITKLHSPKNEFQPTCHIAAVRPSMGKSYALRLPIKSIKPNATIHD